MSCDLVAGRRVAAALFEITAVDHSALAPDTLTTCAHFSMSARKYLSKSDGLIGIGTAPCLAQASFTSARSMTLRTSALRRSMIGCGVAAGAIRPSQIVAS